MCNVMVANSIIVVLDRMIQNGEVFTAFDVTKEVRNSSTDKVSHRDVRNIIRNEFQTGQMSGYNQELHTLDVSGNPQAFVYFPDGKSAQDHSLVDEVSDNLDDDENDDEEDVIRKTKEGRINIPRKILDKVQPVGDSYDFMVNGKLICRKATKKNRIRFSLAELGISGDKCRVTVGDSNAIELESV